MPTKLIATAILAATVTLASPASALANEAVDLVRQFYTAVDAERADPAVYGAMLADGF